MRYIDEIDLCCIKSMYAHVKKLENNTGIFACTRLCNILSICATFAQYANSYVRASKYNSLLTNFTVLTLPLVLHYSKWLTGN